MPWNDAVNDLVRVTTAFTYPGVQLEEMNLWYTVTATAGGGSVWPLFLTNLNASVVGTIVPTLTTGANFYGTKIARISPAPYPMPFTSNTPTLGTLAGPSLGTQTRPLLRLQTALSGRKYRGRMFFPTPDSSVLSGTTFAPTVAMLAVLANFSAASINSIVLTNGATTSTLVPVIAHRPKPKTNPWTWTAITSTSPLNVFATQRRSGGTGRTNILPW